MKHQTLSRSLLVISLLWSSIIFNGCVVEVGGEEPTPPAEGMEALQVPANFLFATTQTVDFQITVKDAQGNPLKSVPLQLYDQAPAEGGALLETGMSDASGRFQVSVSLPTATSEIYLTTTYLGLPSEHRLAILGKQVAYEIGTSGNEREKPQAKAVAYTAPEMIAKYAYLGTWNTSGVPTYLEPQNDVISQSLLDDINASLPETRPVPTYNPQYLVDQEMNTRLRQTADVWVTFVHEGAGWVNTLGFYTYDLANPPASVSDIDTLYIAFPNVSYSGSGGGLRSGNKVRLGRFPANTGIGWFLVPNGWNNSTKAINGSTQTKFSVKQYNNFTTEQYRQHTILLKDDARQLLLLGMEDTSRPGGDNDFNDAIFYVTASPYTAIITDELQTIQQAVDSDGDGVFDNADAFPSDASRAFISYMPGKDKFGSVAFEDNWPSKGDYDFNDLVVHYNYEKVTNSANKVVDLKATYQIKAIGALYQNGFGVEFPFAASEVNSVTGPVRKTNLIQESNFLEQGHSKAVVIVSDHVSATMPRSEGSLFTNVETGKTYVAPVEIKVNMNLKGNIATNNVSAAPFNIFLFVDQDRGREVHLPGQQPTAKANTQLFGSAQDRTTTGSANTYKTATNLPWALQLPVGFEYPAEKNDITKAHLNFKSWAESGGTLFADWYQNKAGYRDVPKIYR